MISKLQSLQSHIVSSTEIISHQSSSVANIQLFRKILYMLFEDPSSSRLAFLICLINLFAILLSLAINIIDSCYDDGASSAYVEITDKIELAIFIIFLLEYLIRLSCCTAYGKSMRQFVFEPMNIIDVLSLVPFIVQTIMASTKVKGFQILRIIRFSRVFRIIKLKRYFPGLSLLQTGVTKSFKQFSFLLAGFLITNIIFSVMIYYSELDEERDREGDTTYINGFYDAFWFCIETITTVGYGDKTPKTLLGRVWTVFLAFLANTIILPLPIAIIGRDFNQAYKDDRESKQIKAIKKQKIVKDSSLKKKEVLFLKERLRMIDEQNKRIKELIEKSTLIAKDITNDLKKLFHCLDDEALGFNQNFQEMINDENQKKIQRSQYGQLKAKANMFEKLLKAKQKIKISNIFRNLNFRSPSLESKDSVNLQGFKKIMTKERIFQKISIDEHMRVKDSPHYSKQSQCWNKRTLKIKSHSVDNENEIIMIKNEEFGQLPYEFLNEIIFQLEEGFSERLNQQNVLNNFQISDQEKRGYFERNDVSEVGPANFKTPSFQRRSDFQNQDIGSSSSCSEVQQVDEYEDVFDSVSKSKRYMGNSANRVPLNQGLRKSVTGVKQTNVNYQYVEEYQQQLKAQAIRYCEPVSINLGSFNEKSQMNFKSLEKSQVTNIFIEQFQRSGDQSQYYE